MTAFELLDERALRVAPSWGELRSAWYAGVDRRIRALARARVQPHPGRDGHLALADDCYGAAGEMIVACATGTYWACGSPALDYAGDVGRYEVRTKRADYAGDAYLRVHERDRDDVPHVLVVPECLPWHRVAGWAYGHEAKQAQYWRVLQQGRRAAYYVPEAELHPISELPL